MRHWKLFGSIVLLVVFAYPLLAQGTTTVTITRVHDGDTFYYRDSTGEVSVRLAGVDCPETNQAYGDQATAFTKTKILNKTVTLALQGRDRNGRTLAEVRTTNGESLSEALIKDGLGWWYHEYAAANKQLGLLEVDARAARKGLWSDTSPTSPWTFRKSVSPQQIAVFRPPTREWFIHRESRTLGPFQFGGPDDEPVPADYLGIGTAQIAVFRKTTGQWFIRHDNGGVDVITWGSPGDIPVPGDYLRLGYDQIAVYQRGTGIWLIRERDGTRTRVQYGGPDDVPKPALYPLD